MRDIRATTAALAMLVLAAAAACTDTTGNGDATPPPPPPTSCGGIGVDPTPPQTTPATMPVLGVGIDTTRYTSEIAVRGSFAYTTTWSVRRAQGNKVNIWDVSANCPVLLDSVIIPGAITTGDVAISDDGTLMVVATETIGGSIAVFGLSDPRHPQLLSRFSNAQTTEGVHTAEIGRVNGKLYAFLSIDPNDQRSFPARLVIVDLSAPSAPRQVYVKIIGNPYVHDTYIRDGYLFLGLWNNGMDIWDVGGGGTGASPENPKVLGNVRTLDGKVHNIWWYHDANGSKKFAFVGEEGQGTVGSTSSGDVHVVDVSDMAHPKEVAFFHVDGAGAHNFSVDEAKGVLYAAYYNGGVRAVDVRGDLGTCTADQKNFNAAANLSRCDLRLMGRELAIGLKELSHPPNPVFVWGVQHVGDFVYASDMLNGLWKLGAIE